MGVVLVFVQGLTCGCHWRADSDNINLKNQSVGRQPFWKWPGNCVLQIAVRPFSLRREPEWNQRKLIPIFTETSGDYTTGVHAMESWKPWKPTTCTSSTETNRDKDQQNLSNIYRVSWFLFPPETSGNLETFTSRNCCNFAGKGTFMVTCVIELLDLTVDSPLLTAKLDIYRVIDTQSPISELIVQKYVHPRGFSESPRPLTRIHRNVLTPLEDLLPLA